jgi:sodium/proline symporter
MALIALGIAMAMAYLSPDRQVFWVIIFGWSGIAACFCPVIILSLFWKGYSHAGAVASMISGFLSVCLFKFVLQPMEWDRALFGETGCLVSFFCNCLVLWVVVLKTVPKTRLRSVVVPPAGVAKDFLMVASCIY